MILRKTKFASVAALMTLASCGGGGGGGGGTTAPAATLAGVVSFTGRVIDGYLQSANVCLDLNLNKVCDKNEPTADAATDANGVYTFTNVSATYAKALILVEVPAGAVDSDTGLAIGKALTMSSPPANTAAGVTNVVSPLTTMVQNQVEQNPTLSTAQAENIVKSSLGLAQNSPVSLFTDYVAASAPASTDPNAADYARTHSIAQVAAQALADQQAAVANGVPGATTADAVNAAVKVVFNTMPAIVQATDLNLALPGANQQTPAQVATASSPAVNAVAAQQAVASTPAAGSVTAASLANFFAAGDSLNWVSGAPAGAIDPATGVAAWPAYYAYNNMNYTIQPNGTYTGGGVTWVYDPASLNPALVGAPIGKGFRKEGTTWSQLILDSNSAWTLISNASSTLTPQADGSVIETQAPVLNPAANPNPAANWQVKHQVTLVDVVGQSIAALAGPGFNTAVMTPGVVNSPVFSVGAKKIIATDTIVNDTYRLDYWNTPSPVTDPVTGVLTCYGAGSAVWVDANTNCAGSVTQLRNPLTGIFSYPVALTDIVVTQQPSLLAGGGLTPYLSGTYQGQGVNALGQNVQTIWLGQDAAQTQSLVVVITQGAGGQVADFYLQQITTGIFSPMVGTAPVVALNIIGQQMWQIDIPASLKPYRAAWADVNASLLLAVQGGMLRAGEFFPAGMIRNVGAKQQDILFNKQALADILTNFVNP